VNRRSLWVTWAVVIAAAFGIVAVTKASGIFYMVIGIIAAAGYTVIAVLTRRPRQPFQPGPEA
jgi:hypothetical protein